ncbi:MAG: hypothetical protein JW839_10200, partial [Candidatus Lokiarchaeota archaeon]|nr:hypothetical protein [Candidatus Lokiarchaeota archaeon]
ARNAPRLVGVASSAGVHICPTCLRIVTTVSGRSLVINLPEDLVKHMQITKGQKVRIRPAGKRKFIVETPDS